VSEEGKWSKTEVGTPQGSSEPRRCWRMSTCIMPSIYGFKHWRKASGDGRHVIVVRYADDIVAGFENRADAERFLSRSGKSACRSSGWSCTRTRRA
jgi:RNA-directed DNA polymerase